MLTYTLRRILSTIPLVLIVAAGTFGLVYLIPGDPARSILGDGATVAQIDAVRRELGLDSSLPVQLGRWISSFFLGDLGNSFQYHVPVTQLIGNRMSVTVSIVIVGLIFSLLIGIPAGVVAGLRPGSKTDRAVTFLTTVGLAVPTFWLAMLLVGLFAISLRMFNATGYTPISDGIGPWLHAMILPGLAVALTSAADCARQTRSSVAAVADADYVRTSRAMGLKTRSIVFRHILRNSGVPIITVAGLQVERLIGAAVVIEIVFGMPGIGQLILTSVLSKDVPTIQGVVVLLGTVIILMNLLVDVSYAWINPRLRKR